MIENNIGFHKLDIQHHGDFPFERKVIGARCKIIRHLNDMAYICKMQRKNKPQQKKQVVWESTIWMAYCFRYHDQSPGTDYNACKLTIRFESWCKTGTNVLSRRKQEQKLEDF